MLRPAHAAAWLALAWSVGAGSASAAPPATQGGTQPHRVECWTDERGQRACGDKVAPGEARRQRELINQRGVVQKVIPAQLTDEEVAAQTKAREDLKHQQDYDRYLLQAYQNVGEIQSVRDERIAALDSRMTLAQKALADNTKVLDDLHQREKAVPDEDQAPNAVLQRQLREFTQALEENRSAIARIARERDSLNEQFARDSQRFQLLRDSARTQVPR